MGLLRRFEDRLGSGPVDLRELVLAVSRIPYGRNAEPSPEAVVDEWRGTCSTKHLLLLSLVDEGWPERPVQLWHRPYVVTPSLARELWGAEIAATIPRHGIVDVHTFATTTVAGGRVRVDVTAPLDDWDGKTDTRLQCGAGEDVPAGDDPLAVKRGLVERLCDPAVREPFIAALTELHRRPGKGAT